MKLKTLAILAVLSVTLPALWAVAQERPDEDVDTTVTKTGEGAGTDDTAKEEAIQDALRKAVEETCGVFIKGKSKTEDFQAVYDKVIAHTSGYVLDYKVLDVKKTDDTTRVRVRARVSTVKFAEDWARIAHTIHQEGNPRVIVVIAEATNWENGKPQYQTESNGTVQSRLQDFLLKKGLQLVDKETAAGVSRRDLALAVLKDDAEKIAAIGAKFNAEVVIVGTANAKFGKGVDIGETGKLYQYNTALNIRAIQTDSARILMSKGFTNTSNHAQRNAEDKALGKLADDAAPKVLADVLEAWRKRASVTKTIELTIGGMNRATWKLFQAEASKIKGMQNLRLREITEGVATIDVEYKFDINTLADRLEALTDVKLEMGDQSANRLSAKVAK